MILYVLCLWAGSAVAAPGVGPNPPAPGFRADASDQRAIEIADEVMEALGGRAAYDRTRYLRWNFLGRRTHLWDKWTGDLRTELVDQAGQHVVLCMNLQRRQGRLWLDGREVTDPAARDEWISRGESMWINDSYWLLMPYKLKDTGVALGYAGEATFEDGRKADQLVLTFEGVGDTPQNKYDVYVARDTHRVVEWSYYENATDPEPTFRLPWRDWRRYGDIYLSGNRGERQITDIAVFDHVDPELFEEP